MLAWRLGETRPESHCRRQMPGLMRSPTLRTNAPALLSFYACTDFTQRPGIHRETGNFRPSLVFSSSPADSPGRLTFLPACEAYGLVGSRPSSSRRIRVNHPLRQSRRLSQTSSRESEIHRQISSLEVLASLSSLFINKKDCCPALLGVF